MKIIDYGILAIVAVVALVLGVLLLPSGPTQASLDSSYEVACEELKTTYDCNQGSVDLITAMKGSGTLYSLGNICAQKGFLDTVSCAESCGCTIQKNETYTELTETPLEVYSDRPVTQGVLIDEEDLFG